MKTHHFKQSNEKLHHWLTWYEQAGSHLELQAESENTVGATNSCQSEELQQGPLTILWPLKNHRMIAAQGHGSPIPYVIL